MREPHRSPQPLLRLAFLALILGVPGPAGLAHAQTPASRLLTLEEAGSDVRVDPVLGLLVRRADQQSGLAAATESAPLTMGDGTGGFANFLSAMARPDMPVAVIIEGTPDRLELESKGIVVGTVAGDVVTATLPLSLVPVLLTVSGVEKVSAAAPVEKALNVSADEIDADVLWAGNPPTYPAGSLTGNGVIVGIVDTGVDPRVADFRDTANKTRFKYAWDQQWSGIPPAPYAYGVEYTEAQINANQIEEFRDYDGHGTHVAGIAAGNGQSTGNGQPAWNYVGVAPRSNIIAVKAYMLESQIIDAVNYVFLRSATLNRAAVVNLSLSLTKGGHDGSYSFDRALSALTGPGKVITAAAGNRGLENGHAKVNLASGASQDISFTIPTYTPSQTQTEYLILEGWHNSSASFDVKVISPSGITSTTVLPGIQTGYVVTNDGTVLIQNGITTNLVGAKQILVTVAYGTPGTPRPKSGTWRVNLKRRSGTTTGTCDFWVSQHFFATTVLPAFSGSTVDTAGTVTSPATGDSIISTGAYATKVSWTNNVGSTSRYPNSPPLYRVADFSSRGPRRDGQQRPDLMAPGFGVMSSMSTNALVSATYQDPDGKHYIAKGTSVANAHTTGSIALLMEQNRYLTPSGARLTLRNRARTDSYTGSVPNGKWGYGKLDLSPGAVTGVNDGIALGLSFSNVFPNPSQDMATFEFVVNSVALSQGSSTPVRVRIIDVRGREVAEVTGVAVPGPQRLTWDGRNSDGAPVAAGVYFARLTVGTTQLQKKFVRIEQ
jgi:subtilisin family serine protease